MSSEKALELQNWIKQGMQNDQSVCVPVQSEKAFNELCESKGLGCTRTFYTAHYSFYRVYKNKEK